MRNLLKVCGGFYFLAGVLILLGSSAIGWAQLDTTATGRTPAISRDMRYREWQLKELEKSSKAKPDSSEARIAWNEIREDYKELQLSNNELHEKIGNGAGENYLYLAAAANKIGKYAASLKKNLPLPELEKNPTTASGKMPLDRAFKILDGIVIRFANNPVFKDTQVVDAENGKLARRDLELIIIISETLEKRAKILQKEAKK